MRKVIEVSNEYYNSDACNATTGQNSIATRYADVYVDNPAQAKY